MIERRHASATVRAVLALVVLLHAGCETPPAGGGAMTEAPDPPPYEELMRVQNARVALLNQFYSRGVVELRWTDDEGREHFEGQVALELWVRLSRRTAVRMEKLGDVLLWLGSDEQSMWLFDLMSDVRTLYLAQHGDRVTLAEADALAVQPKALLDLMGLTALPAAAATSYDRTFDAWVVSTDGRGGPVRIFFGRGDLLPVRVEMLDDAGGVQVASTISRYVRVSRRGMSVLELPKLGEMVRVEDRARGAELKVALDGPERGDDQPFDRVFDLDRLRRAMATDRVVDRRSP